MIIPKPEYRPNSDRAIFVQGVIDQSLYQRLSPQIISLQHQSREPITIYIDSLGGQVTYLVALLRLLRATNQDYDNSCYLITVVTHQVASAAADLLSAGDYALAYPESKVLFHGVRLVEDELTAERSTFWAQYLRVTNESSAMELASQIEYRFMFRFVIARLAFDEIRQNENNPNMSDLECFLHYISQRLSDTARGILEIARQRYSRYDELLESILKKTNKLSPNKTPLELEAAQIKAIVDFEVKQNKNKIGWTFREEGIHRLTDDFLLYREYRTNTQSQRFMRWCSNFGHFLLPNEKVEEIRKIEDSRERILKWTEETTPILEPVWKFFLALCNALQREENDFLTAHDAFWLGLIDEVIGDKDLLPYRYIQENVEAPNQQNATTK